MRQGKGAGFVGSWREIGEWLRSRVREGIRDGERE